MNDTQQEAPISGWLSLAVNCAVIGLSCILLFLWQGFGAWSMGLGMFVGMPLLLVAVVIYIFSVARDLKQRGAL